MRQILLTIFLIIPFCLPANEDDIYYQSHEVQEELQILNGNTLNHLQDAHRDAYRVAINTIVLVALQGIVTLNKIKLINKCFSNHDLIQAIETIINRFGILPTAEILSSVISNLAYFFPDISYLSDELILQQIADNPLNQ